MKFIKNLVAKAKALFADAKPELAVVAGLAAQAVALGVAHGVALNIARGVLALATLLGVSVAKKATVAKAAVETLPAAPPAAASK